MGQLENDRKLRNSSFEGKLSLTRMELQSSYLESIAPLIFSNDLFRRKFSAATASSQDEQEHQRRPKIKPPRSEFLRFSASLLLYSFPRVGLNLM